MHGTLHTSSTTLKVCRVNVSKMLPEKDWATATVIVHKKFGKVWMSGFWDMQVNRQTDRQTDTNHNTLHTSHRQIYNSSQQTAQLATIANPTSAFLSAGPSLVPSPVTATTSRLSVSLLSIMPFTSVYLSSGDDRASTRSCGHTASNLSASTSYQTPHARPTL